MSEVTLTLLYFIGYVDFLDIWFHKYWTWFRLNVYGHHWIWNWIGFIGFGARSSSILDIVFNGLANGHHWNWTRFFWIANGHHWNWIWFFLDWIMVFKVIGCGLHWIWSGFFQRIRIVSLKSEMVFLGFRSCVETFISKNDLWFLGFLFFGARLVKEPLY